MIVSSGSQFALKRGDSDIVALCVAPGVLLDAVKGLQLVVIVDDAVNVNLLPSTALVISVKSVQDAIQIPTYFLVRIVLQICQGHAH